MSGNTFGRVLRLSTFGESHGSAIGGVLDGCPPGLQISEEDIQAELDRRKPGFGATATARKEGDRIQLLSGIWNGQTTGTPIGFIIANEDQRSRDYGNLADIFRPGHADWPYFAKFQGVRDFRGGGRASGRETACRVAAGAIAKKILASSCGGEIWAGSVELGGIPVELEDIDLLQAYKRDFFAAADNVIGLWHEKVRQTKELGDTLGGVVEIRAASIPPGLGEPVFDKLDARLAYALMGVGAVKAVEIGAGTGAARLTGSQNNDFLHSGEPRMLNGRPNPVFGSNNAGGIVGGISTGQEIVLRAHVKPIASISISQPTIDRYGNDTHIEIGGRHDLAAIPRIVPVLAAMTALTLADALLLQRRIVEWK